MPAPDYPTLYRFEDTILPQYAAVLTAASVTNYRMRSTSDLTTPRVELEMHMGGTDGHGYVTPSGHVMHDRWTFTIHAKVVTARNQSASSHATYLGKVRHLLLAPSTTATINAALSYHTICKQLQAEQPPEMEAIADEDHDETQLKFSGMVSIRTDAWPSSAP